MVIPRFGVGSGHGGVGMFGLREAGPVPAFGGKEQTHPNGGGGQNRVGIPFWLVGEFTAHFTRII